MCTIWSEHKRNVNTSIYSSSLNGNILTACFSTEGLLENLRLSIDCDYFSSRNDTWLMLINKWRLCLLPRNTDTWHRLKIVNEFNSSQDKKPFFKINYILITEIAGGRIWPHSGHISEWLNILRNVAKFKLRIFTKKLRTFLCIFEMFLRKKRCYLQCMIISRRPEK
jgi:hypothetical protein